MTKFKIERGVQLPTGRNNAVYPFGDMEVGDSFLVPGEGDFAAPRRAAGVYGRRSGLTFTCRKTPEGLRIWRTA